MSIYGVHKFCRSALHDLDHGLEDRQLLVRLEGIVLADRAEGDDAVDPVADQVVDNALCIGEVNGQVFM